MFLNLDSYFFASIIAFIFTNLGERKPWQLSAYSIFNPNFERLPGTMSVGDIQSSMGFNTIQREVVSQNGTTEENQISTTSNQSALYNERTFYESKSEIRKRELKQNAKQPLNSSCNCGSEKKYKNCCAKKSL